MVTDPSRPGDAETNSLAPTVALMLPMRDGVRLATYVRLPDEDGPHPIVLFRSVYRDSLLGWGAFHLKEYLAAGYGVAWQSTRGTGFSEGRHRFLEDEGADGFDTVEWIAAQPWCDGRVAMDGHSYLAMAQMAAAAATPPHLAAIMPQVPSARFFRESPYFGGVFMRLHTLNWLRLISIASPAELGVGFMNPAAALADPDFAARLRHRPLDEAADGWLEGDRLDQFKAFARRDVYDDRWRALEMGPQDFARVNVPVLLVGGNFDLNVGAFELWRGLVASVPDPERLHLLMGPWTHGQVRTGASARLGPYDFEGRGSVDMAALKIAFLDHYLRGAAPVAPLPRSTRLFVTGTNTWLDAGKFPVAEVRPKRLWLASRPRADGTPERRLQPDGSAGAPDVVLSDPAAPIVIVPTGELMDYATVIAREDVLLFETDALDASVTILGEPQVDLHVAVDAPDADVIVRLMELYPDGRAFALGFGGALRLRYRNGFDRPSPVEVGIAFPIQLTLSYVAHSVAAGHRLGLLILPSDFPSLDPNPHTAEPTASAVTLRTASLSVLHDDAHPSGVTLPLLEVELALV